MTLVQSDWRPKNRRFGHTETRGARAQGETLDTARRRSPEQQEEEASIKRRLCWHLDLRLPASGTVRTKSLLFISHPASGISLQQLRLPKTCL